VIHETYVTSPPTVRSILAALDESQRAPMVFATAASMAQSLGAELFLVRALVVPPDIPPAAHTHPNGLEAKLERDARAELHALMDSVRGVTFGPPIVVEGDPWRRILDVAQELDVDLIVAGSHRYHGLDRVLGTTAAKLVNHADRNVLIVHERRPSSGP
jgi:nucleotide-binding universal stress UspA family protein